MSGASGNAVFGSVNHSSQFRFGFSIRWVPEYGPLTAGWLKQDFSSLRIVERKRSGFKKGRLNERRGGERNKSALLVSIHCFSPFIWVRIFRVTQASWSNIPLSSCGTSATPLGGGSYTEPALQCRRLRRDRGRCLQGSFQTPDGMFGTTTNGSKIENWLWCFIRQNCWFWGNFPTFGDSSRKDSCLHSRPSVRWWSVDGKACMPTGLRDGGIVGLTKGGFTNQRHGIDCQKKAS